MPGQTDPELDRLRQATAGRYVIDRELGRGGMGIVYLARDVALDRPVAIKLLPAALAARPAMRTRFLQEARTAARLAHPNIVPIHAVEEHGSVVFFVMRWVRGESLGARVRRTGPLPVADATRILQETAWALGHAHAHGTLHRDVKPDNILLEDDSGRALVTDFGIAHTLLSPGDTPAGDILGTMEYMSPEQAAGEALDGRSDIYALGGTAFFALTGRLPFQSSTAAGYLHQHRHVAAATVASIRPGLPPSLAAVVDRCLAKSPADRFATAEELAEAMAPAVRAMPAVPGAVRRVHEEAREFVADSGGALSVAAIIGLQGLVIALHLPAGLDEGAGFFNGIALAGLAVLLGARGSALMVRVREAAREGVSREMIAAGAAQLGDTDRETQRPLSRSRNLAVRFAGGWAVLAWAWINDLQGLIRHPSVQMFAGVATLIFALLLGRAAAEQLFMVKQGFWSRFWNGGLGRLVFAKATFGLKPASVAEAGGPTAVVLADAAEQMLRALPPGERERLDGLPDVIRELRVEAERARERMAIVPEGAERHRASERLAIAVAALDAVRLDLVRLGAGLAPTGGLTAQVKAAVQLGEDVDARLSAIRQLEGGLHASTPVTPTSGTR